MGLRVYVSGTPYYTGSELFLKKKPLGRDRVRVATRFLQFCTDSLSFLFLSKT